MEDSPDALNDLLERERMIVRIARLEAALREALDGWQYAMNRACSQHTLNLYEERIAELRKFLDDK